MATDLNTDLVREIRALYESDPATAEARIEALLMRRWRHVDEEQRLVRLGELERRFAGVEPASAGSHACTLEPEVVSRLLTLFLGAKAPRADLDHDQLMERLSQSLNTIFDALNQVIIAIHSMLLGQDSELETIRQVIGSDLQHPVPSDSLANHLDQIRQAFLVCHQAFLEAARNKIEEILGELDPRAMAEEQGGSSVTVGPWKRARLFDEFTARYEKIEDWFRSERFRRDILREFEKHCRLCYAKGRVEK